MKEDFLKAKSVKELAKGVLYYNASSVLGPLILFVGLGLILDNTLDTKPYLTLSGLVIAFIITNLLIFKKVRQLMKKFKQKYPLEEEEKNKPHLRPAGGTSVDKQKIKKTINQ